MICRQVYESISGVSLVVGFVSRAAVFAETAGKSP